uniref:Elicitin n=1 Tax=Pythium aphanidermatum TaxID=65070 RepID=Q56VT9_PYTAP|nr:secretory protein PaE1 [Pythium aphanidermatum]
MYAKTLLVGAVAALAAVNTAPCDMLTEVTKLTPLISDPNVAKCSTQEESGGFALIPPSGLPTPDQYKKMCVSDACKKVIEAVASKNPGDYDLTVGSVTLNVKQLVSNFPTECAKYTTPATTAPAPTTTAPAPSSGPAPSSSAPAPTGQTTPAPTGQSTPAPTKAQC